MDIDYWNNYYKIGNVISEPSSFAEFCLNEFMPDGARIIELGSGNGRDSLYFARHGFDVIAIDQSHSACLYSQEQADKNSLDRLKFIESDFTNNNFDEHSIVDVFYSRFTMHSITFEQQNRLLKNVHGKLHKGGLFFIEARTIHDPLCGVGTDIEDFQFVTDHYRRFIDSDQFVKQCLDLGFKLKFMIEKDGLSVVKDDNPVLLRLVLSTD